MMTRTFAFTLVASLALASTAAAHGGKRGKRFEKLDTDGDGRVTLAELSAHVEERFAGADANRDGRVTREELRAHHEQKRAEWKNKRGRAHAAPDGAAGSGGGDGRAQRRAERFEKMKERFAAKLDERFAKLDANNDGALSKAEISGHAKAKFAKLDANNDGALERSELGKGRHCGDKGKRGKRS